MACPTVSGQGCLANAAASMWVYLYHSVFKNSAAVDHENSEIRMSLIQQDLLSCAEKLGIREAELMSKIRDLTGEALHRKSIRDLAGARKKLATPQTESLTRYLRRKKLVERKRAQAQLDKLTSSISIVDMHINTIEGTELNKSILETLKASGDALRKMGAGSGGIEEVEKVVNDVEIQVEAAAEVTRVIASANVSGALNFMGHDVFTEEELEAELNDLIGPDDDDLDRFEDAPVRRRTGASGPAAELADRFPPVPSQQHHRRVASLVNDSNSPQIAGGQAQGEEAEEAGKTQTWYQSMQAMDY